jgi:hypothetical protein
VQAHNGIQAAYLFDRCNSYRAARSFGGSILVDKKVNTPGWTWKIFEGVAGVKRDED